MPKVSANEKYDKKYSEESLRKALEEIEQGASKKATSKNTIYLGLLSSLG